MTCVSGEKGWKRIAPACMRTPLLYRECFLTQYSGEKKLASSTHLARVAADLLSVYKRGPDPPQLNLDGVAADEIPEQVVLERRAIRGCIAVPRVEVTRHDLRVEPVSRFVGKIRWQGKQRSKRIPGLPGTFV